MKNRETVNQNEGYRLEAEALRILEAIPGLDVVRQRAGRNHQADFLVSFGGAHVLVAVEVKRSVNAATAWQLVNYARTGLDNPLLLIAGQTTAEARDILTQHGIAVVDGLGNAHIELPGLLLHLQGYGRAEQQPATDLPPTRLRGKAGVAAQALLLHPDRDWQVLDLAREAGISTGLAHRVLSRLETQGLVATDGAGPKQIRRVTNPTALLDLWDEENVDKPWRMLGYRLAQTPQQLMMKVGKNLEDSGIDYAITGAAAASRVAPFISALPIVDVWVTAHAGPRALQEAAAAEPVTDGHNVVFLQAKNDTSLALRERADGLWLVNRFRLYSDLRRDPRRGREQAEHLRREVIGF